MQLLTEREEANHGWHGTEEQSFGVVRIANSRAIQVSKIRIASVRGVRHSRQTPVHFAYPYNIALNAVPP